MASCKLVQKRNSFLQDSSLFPSLALSSPPLQLFSPLYHMLSWGNLPSLRGPSSVLILHTQRVKWLQHSPGMNIHCPSAAVQWTQNADGGGWAGSARSARDGSALPEDPLAQWSGSCCLWLGGFCEFLSGFRSGSNLRATVSLALPASHQSESSQD